MACYTDTEVTVSAPFGTTCVGEYTDLVVVISASGLVFGCPRSLFAPTDALGRPYICSCAREIAGSIPDRAPAAWVVVRYNAVATLVLGSPVLLLVVVDVNSGVTSRCGVPDSRSHAT